MPGKAAVSLSAKLSDLPAVRGHAPWPNHEYVKGWGVFGLPFDSGHVLALRVFPENDFSPYRTVWHRDPGGRGRSTSMVHDSTPPAPVTTAGPATSPGAPRSGSPGTARQPCA